MFSSEWMQNDTDAETVRLGSVIQGTYRVLEPLSRGGMGEVYLASHERLPGRYALKVPHRHLCTDPAFLTRFCDEARLLASLRHPNIVQIVDFDLAPCGTPFLVMELVEGATLRQHLQVERAFAPGRVAEIVGQVASALQAAHEGGILHLDLKLENVMLTSCAGHPDLVKLLDFGIAQLASAVTDQEVLAGTPQFMAPELIEGAPGSVDDRADQFALACLAYTLLAGEEPFRGEGRLATLYQVLHREPRPVEELVGASYALAGRVIERGLAKDPVCRYATVVEFAATLKAALELGEREGAALRPAA